MRRQPGSASRASWERAGSEAKPAASAVSGAPPGHCFAPEQAGMSVSTLQPSLAADLAGAVLILTSASMVR
jgi:hypothetical protein